MQQLLEIQVIKTLQEAINAVGEGGTIQLLGSVIENIVSKDKSYILEMNGNTNYCRIQKA